MEKSLVIIPTAIEKALRLEYEVKLFDGDSYEVTEQAFQAIMDDSVPKDSIIKGKDFLFRKSAVASAQKIKDYAKEKAVYIRKIEEEEERKAAIKDHEEWRQLDEKRKEWAKNNPEEFQKLFEISKLEIFGETEEGSIMRDQVEHFAKIRARSKIIF